MLQQENPEDLVIATGEAHSVREFVDLAFSHAGLDPAEHVVLDQRFHRPAEVDILLGNAAKARAKLGWHPTVDFASLVREMVEADLRDEAATLKTGTA